MRQPSCFGAVLAVLATMAIAASGSAATQLRPCGWAKKPPKIYRHVIWIWMENHPFASIVGSPDAPYINGLANSCGLATNYQAIGHPSLPNYIAATSGDTQGITKDCSPDECTVSAPSIFSQLRSAGKAWRSYAESMPSPCTLSNAGDYLVRHNPPVYYSEIRGDCSRWTVPLGSSTGGNLVTALTSNRLAAFSYIAPNRCSDMHDCSVATGDQWLRTWVQKIVTSKTYRLGGTVLFITWDEGDAGDNRVATIVVSPSTHARTRSSVAFDHYSLLKTTEQLLGIKAFLGNAAAPNTTSMRRAFHL